jgi:NAD(P)-dependent dehydrogenase (short-subunit alcohol dehydrogenase family)
VKSGWRPGISQIGQLLLFAAAAWTATYSRLILGPLQEAMRQSLAITDNRMAILQGSAIAVPMALGAIPVGLLADRVSRKAILLAATSLALIALLLIGTASVGSWFASPFIATYCASKAAEEILTDAIRIQLRAQGTHVAGVYAGYIDTDMSAHITYPKTSPARVVERSLAGLESGAERIFADDSAVYVDQQVRTNRATFDLELARHWQDSQPQN